MRKLVAGNWKMNGTAAGLEEAVRIAEGARELQGRVDVMLCPPATLIDRMRQRCGDTPLMIGGQDCHEKDSGAFTGDVSAAMLADAGAGAVIVGHSERRTLHGERDAAVRAKAEAARRAELTAIICVGETEAERDAGATLAVVDGQLTGSLPDGEPRGLVVAYEPVWAIGMGRTPSRDDISAVHSHIRRRLVDRFGEAGREVRILYGGSMNPANAAAILPIVDVDGGLVGGASLKADDFLAIVRAAV